MQTLHSRLESFKPQDLLPHQTAVAAAATTATGGGGTKRKGGGGSRSKKAAVTPADQPVLSSYLSPSLIAELEKATGGSPLPTHQGWPHHHTTQNLSGKSTARKTASASKSDDSVKATPALLAEAGFFFTPTTTKPDCVTCFLCEAVVFGWKQSSLEPFEAHSKASSTCPWVQVMVQGRSWAKKFNSAVSVAEDLDEGQAAASTSASSTRSKKHGGTSAASKNAKKKEAVTSQEQQQTSAVEKVLQEYMIMPEAPWTDAMVAYREATFQCGWPYLNNSAWKCSARKIAETGMFYIPNTDENDYAECLYCHLGLAGWEVDDDPMLEHRKRSPDCVIFQYKEAFDKFTTHDTTTVNTHSETYSSVENTAINLTAAESTKPNTRTRSRKAKTAEVDKTMAEADQSLLLEAADASIAVQLVEELSSDIGPDVLAVLIKEPQATMAVKPAVGRGRKRAPVVEPEPQTTTVDADTTLRAIDVASKPSRTRRQHALRTEEKLPDPVEDSNDKENATTTNVEPKTRGRKRGTTRSKNADGAPTEMELAEKSSRPTKTKATRKGGRGRKKGASEEPDESMDESYVSDVSLAESSMCSETSVTEHFEREDAGDSDDIDKQEEDDMKSILDSAMATSFGLSLANPVPALAAATAVPLVENPKNNQTIGKTTRPTRATAARQQQQTVEVVVPTLGTADDGQLLDAPHQNEEAQDERKDVQMSDTEPLVLRTQEPQMPLPPTAAAARKEQKPLEQIEIDATPRAVVYTQAYQADATPSPTPQKLEHTLLPIPKPLEALTHSTSMVDNSSSSSSCNTNAGILSSLSASAGVVPSVSALNSLISSMLSETGSVASGSGISSFHDLSREQRAMTVEDFLRMQMKQQQERVRRNCLRLVEEVKAASERCKQRIETI